jgi:L-iditol 2-dehydrogenase
MKKMVLTGIREMELREVPEPEIQAPADVKIRMEAVGVCGSDIHYYVSGNIGTQVVEYPFAVGHECAGTVVEVGASVTRVQPGDRVAIEPAMTCGTCDQCLSGRSNTCRNNRFLGCPGQADGSLCEVLVMPEQNCFPIRATTSFANGTISEPLAIGIYAVKHSIAMKGARVGILGMGPIGFCVMLPALEQGAGPLYCTDKIGERLELAKQGGATWTGNPDREDVVAAILDQEPLGLDVVFECCGHQEAIDQGVRILRPGGRLMLIGIPSVERVSFQIEILRRKEIHLVNVRRQEGCVQDALDLIEDHRINVDQMVTHRFPFERTKEAFDLVAGYRDGVLKAMIDFT